MRDPQYTWANLGTDDEVALVRLRDIVAVYDIEHKKEFLLGSSANARAIVITPHGSLPVYVPPRTVALRIAIALYPEEMQSKGFEEDSWHPSDLAGG